MAQHCGAALSMCAFHGWVHKARIPLACLRVFVWLCVCAHICAVGGGVLQQQTGLISDIKQSHISGRKQTELAVALHLHSLQVHASRPSTSRKQLSHKDINLQSKPLMGIWLSWAINSPPPSVLLPSSHLYRSTDETHMPHRAGIVSC